MAEVLSVAPALCAALALTVNRSDSAVIVDAAMPSIISTDMAFFFTSSSVQNILSKATPAIKPQL